MPRRKRQHPLIKVARAYLSEHQPALKEAPLRIHLLDGPPGSPRYAVSIEQCRANGCPYEVPPEDAANGRCPIIDCPVRHSIRLLFDRNGTLVNASESGIHWG